MNNIESRLMKLIIEQGKGEINGIEFSDELNLIEDLMFDSISFLELIVEIENEFGIEFDEEDIDIDSFSNYGNLRKLLLEKNI